MYLCRAVAGLSTCNAAWKQTVFITEIGDNDLICTWLFSSLSVLGAGVWWWLFGCWLFLAWASAEQSEQDLAASVCPGVCISHTWAGWCFCAHSLHGRRLWERLARVAATSLFLAQGRSTWEGWQADVAAGAVPWPPSPDHHPSQGSLELDEEQAGYTVVPDVTLSLVRTGDDDELLALPQQLIFKLQYVPVPPKGRSSWVGCSSRESWSSQTKPRCVLRFSLSKETS